MTEKLKFRYKTEVHKYLQSTGFDVGTSKLSSKVAADLKGIPKKDGYWQQLDIDNYAKYGALKRLEGAMSADASAVAEELQREKLGTEKAKRIKAERENEIAEGLWILLQEAEQQQTLKIQLFKSALENLAYSIMPELIDLVKGDNERIPDGQELFLKAIRKKLDDYAKPCKYEVPNFINREAEEEAEL
jgi:hypothetical protein